MIESKYLKDNMQNIQRLMEIPALRHFELKTLSNLLKLSKIREYSHGEFIITEGDDDPWLYFLLKGKVHIEKEGVEIGSIDKKGEIFGEMRIIDTMSRSASVVAEGKTVCLAVDISAQDKFSSGGKDKKLDFLLLLYRIFAEFMSMRLRITTDKLKEAKVEIKELKKKSVEQIQVEQIPIKQKPVKQKPVKQKKPVPKKPKKVNVEKKRKKPRKHTILR